MNFIYVRDGLKKKKNELTLTTRPRHRILVAIATESLLLLVTLASTIASATENS